MKSKGNRIMVADDNAFVRFLTKKWLGDDADIVEVGNGAEVMPTYKKARPDILFLDIHLPGMNGMDVLKALRNYDQNAFIIMLSADSNKDNVVEAVRLGATAFITKPFTRDTLNKYYTMCPTITHSAPAEAAETGAPTAPQQA